MSRAFNIQVNVGDLDHELISLSDSDIASWTKGFQLGLHGKDFPMGGGSSMYCGHAFGFKCYERAKAFMERSAAGGRLSAERRERKYGTSQPKREGPSEPPSEPPSVLGSEANSEQTINHKQETINKKQETNSSSDKSDMSGFEAWWDSYGKKVGKKAAAKEWSKLTPEDRDAALRATPAYVAWKSDPQYRKDPERFLKHRHWEDQIPVHTPADTKDDTDYDPFMDGAITDPDEVRRLLGYSNER